MPAVSPAPPPEVAPPAVEKTAGPLAMQIEALVLKKIADDQLGLPPLPNTIARCMEQLKSPTLDLKDLVPCLETDPMLAARVFRLANSAAFGVGAKSATLLSAIARLGVKRVKTVLIEAAAERLFESKDATIAGMTARLWQHSLAVGIVARDLCALTGRADSEEACLGGLLHDVGKPIVASVMLEAERQIVEIRGRTWVGSDEWAYVVNKTHRTVGMAVAAKWDLPDVVKHLVRDSSEFDAVNRGALSNVVCFANALTKTAGINMDSSELEDAKALVMIGKSLLGLDDQLVNSIIVNARARVNEVV